MTEEQMYNYLTENGYSVKNVDNSFTVLCKEGQTVVLSAEDAIHITMKDGETAVMGYGYADYSIARNPFGILEIFRRETEEKPKKKSSGLGALAALAGAMGGGVPPVIQEEADCGGSETE